MLKYISNEAHYTEVLAQITSAKRTLWLGTADIKDLYTDFSGIKAPFLKELALLIRRGVGVRLIHAKEPGPAFREDFDRYPSLINGLERVLCPRVHFKLVIIDNHFAYIGSANLTGAGIGMKSAGTRNFESGIFTDLPEIVGPAIAQFDAVWMGAGCKGCKRRDFCGDPIDGVCL